MTAPEPTPIDDTSLRAWPLPWPDREGDKEERGGTLVVGGSRELAGAVILAGTAALRAGAGKLMIATAQSVAREVAVVVPEARVLGLPETSGGGFAPEGVAALRLLARKVDALLLGPGMQDDAAASEFVRALLPAFLHARIVLDAAAMNAACAGVLPGEADVLLTPHAGEMAHLRGMPKEQVLADPVATAREASQRFHAVVALKGATTFIATPDGALWRHDGGNVGLATSGSGDVLAGVIAGLAARGAPLPQAAAWGVALHARAGQALAARLGTLGYLARELPGEIPALMQRLAGAPPAPEAGAAAAQRSV
jgi:ADP-dependent NAD(P)H-hydrate dehydratase